jgi:hypothetical protein
MASRRSNFGLRRAVRAQFVRYQHLGCKALFLEQLLHQFQSWALSRRRCTRRSRTTPSSSTARHSHRPLPKRSSTSPKSDRRSPTFPTPQTVSLRANPLNSRGIVGDGEPSAVRADFLVVEAVRRNGSPRAILQGRNREISSNLVVIAGSGRDTRVVS